MKGKLFSFDISEEAESDFDIFYYENPKIAETFFQRINNSLKKIKKTPISFPEVHKNLRKYTVKKFPFVIYYQVVAYTIRVIAIFHTSKNPEIWNERIVE